jgi:hypothetical protein
VHLPGHQVADRALSRLELVSPREVLQQIDEAVQPQLRQQLGAARGNVRE